MADVVERTVRTSVVLKKNERVVGDHDYYKPDVTFTEHTSQRLVLSTNMATASQIDLSGVETGAVFAFRTDRTVKLGIDQDTNMLQISDNGMMVMVGSFTHVYVQNESTTYQATIEVLACD